jgi:hypothetical protein
MRTTIDMPDALYRKTKAVAALRGSSMKDLIVRAVEADVNQPPVPSKKPNRVKLPLIRATKGHKIDLTSFDFDDLLG